MSYEGTNCPCGGKKQPSTMLCEVCEATFADHPSMHDFKNERLTVEVRRHAATTLLALARGRKRVGGGYEHDEDLWAQCI